MKLLKVLFVIFIIAVFAVCGVSYWLYSSLNKPHQHDKAGKFIVIEKGMSPNEIISKLAAENIICRRNGDARLSADIRRRFKTASRRLQFRIADHAFAGHFRTRKRQRTNCQIDDSRRLHAL